MIAPELHRSLRTIESAQGPNVVLDGREVLLLCSNDYLAQQAPRGFRACGQREELRQVVLVGGVVLVL